MEVYYNKWIPANPSGSDGAWEKGFPNKGFFMHWNPRGDMAGIKTEDNIEIYVPKEEVSFMDPHLDWEQRRYELAKAAMGAMLVNQNIVDRHDETVAEWISKHSILQADEMIEQLQKPKP